MKKHSNLVLVVLLALAVSMNRAAARQERLDRKQQQLVRKKDRDKKKDKGNKNKNNSNNQAGIVVASPTPPPTVLSESSVVANDDGVTVPVGASSAAIKVLENDTGNNLIVTRIASQASDGACSVSGIGSTDVVYAPRDPNFVGVDACAYEACDDEGDCDTATVYVKFRETLRSPPR